tara:strand:- start:864 stop:1424 length:561 start_codon:yes stop_codon:yes gene_type:complete
MKMEYDFIVKRPIEEVWNSFKDIPTVASCMPGAELTENEGDGKYKGNVKVKLGPFSVFFEGQAEVKFDDNSKSGSVNGNGIDKKGGNRTKLSMNFNLENTDEGTKTIIDSDIQLSGAIAQFGRVGIIKETANILIGKFSENLENKLSNETNEIKDQNKDKANKDITISDLLRGFLKWLYSLLPFRQ